jgi:hypothetical protein
MGGRLAPGTSGAELPRRTGNPLAIWLRSHRRSSRTRIRRSRKSACYMQGPYQSDGQLLVVRSTGATFVMVFSFVDGTRKAIGVGCSIGGCGYSEPYRERPKGVTLTPGPGEDPQ